MSRPDHELANSVLRDALWLACETIAQLAKDKPESVASELEQWRMLVERTQTEDNEDDPPFSEAAREAAWRAWIESAKRCGVEIKPTRGDRRKLDEFREWWMDNTQMRRRGLLQYGPEQLTPTQQASARLGYLVEDDD